jgi:hypothetical protein
MAAATLLSIRIGDVAAGHCAYEVKPVKSAPMTSIQLAGNCIAQSEAEQYTSISGGIWRGNLHLQVNPAGQVANRRAEIAVAAHPMSRSI